VLEVAANSKAKAIITFNPKDFKGVKEKFNIDILTPKQFLQEIGEIK
jgi:predicted nucleic acid-binding protein